jgi:hypothetical protein
MSAPVVEQPDVEALVWSQIEPLRGATSFAYAATQIDRLGWQYAVFVQVDARHADKKRARDLAERVRQIMTGLGDVDWADGVVSYSQAVEGPFYLPDDDNGGPRYVARYEIRVHPPRRATVPARM